MQVDSCFINDADYQMELKNVEADLKQLSIEAIEIFQQLKLRGIITEDQYQQMVKEKLQFLSGIS